MTTPRKEMESALKDAIAADLRPAGFCGAFPHLRRLLGTRIDLMSFQFHSAGGSFVIEVAACDPDGLTTSWGTHIEATKVRAHDVSPMLRPRLGSPRFPEFGDHWFEFGSRNYEPGAKEVKPREHYEAIADDVMQLVHSQAEAFWSSDPTSE